MAARKRPASRGFVNNIILESLLSGDKYGYEIIKEVEDKSNGKIILKQPSLYSSLKRFEAKGYITSYWGASDIGGRRHYYTITEVGRNYFNKDNKEKDFDLDDVDDTNETQQIAITDAEEDSTNNNVEEDETTSLVTDTESEDYNVFALLENSNPKETPAPKENKLSNIKQKETSIQVDMFSNNQQQNEVNQEETINIEKIQQLKLSDSPAPQKDNDTPKKDIPLIKERQEDFFSWEDLKRKQVANNTTPEEPKQEPIKNQVVMDQYGILKVGETIEKKEQKIYDNVGTRIEYNDPVIKKNTQTNTSEELSEEERELKNRKFNEKLDNLISQKTGVTSPSQVSQPEEDDDDNVDYKNILGELLATDDEKIEQEPIQQNYYTQEDLEDEVIEEVIQKVETYNYSAKNRTANFESDGFKFKPYVTEVDEADKQTNFILSNKARLNYGIFMFVLMILQISTLFIILKAQNLLYTTDYVLYGIAYGVAVVLLLVCLIPYLIIPDKRKSNTFKLSYSLLFGILLFLSACALTYALNTFAGLNSANVSQFSTKLLLPIILSINFIITPLVYKMVTLDKKMY